MQNYQRGCLFAAEAAPAKINQPPMLTLTTNAELSPRQNQQRGYFFAAEAAPTKNQSTSNVDPYNQCRIINEAESTTRLFLRG
jgi:hypothetical protein